jgi:hypothetical protein
MPEQVMAEPEHRPDGRLEEPTPADDPQGRDAEERDESYWQWVALAVLLACWLAEATV